MFTVFTKNNVFSIIPVNRGVCDMRILSVSDFPVQSTKSNKTAFKSKVHIVDGFIHADTMEHFTKAALKKSGRVSDVQMHYVECNSRDINTKQMRSVEDKLKELSYSVKNGDFIVIPGLASVPLLNLKDRIYDVLGKNVNLTALTLKSYKDVLLEFLKEIYNYKYTHSSDISYMDKNSQQLEYSYGVIEQINNMVRKGVNVYIPAGHGADSTIKWMAKDEGLSDELYKYIATGRDPQGQIRKLFDRAKSRNYYDFNLLSLSNAHIVNVKDRNFRDYIFSAQDGFVNDSAKGVYNFSPVRSSSGQLLGYSFHDESTVEYPYHDYRANEQIENLCRYVGLPKNKFQASYSETNQFKEYVKKGRSTSSLPDKLYKLSDVFDSSEIRRRKLDTLGTLIDRNQNLIFDTNDKGKIIFQKTNCEGSDKPSVIQMWGSCFSAVNAMIRDAKKGGNISSSGSSTNSSYLINQADKYANRGDVKTAEYYYNEALAIMHPNKAGFNYDSGTIEVYEKLYKLLKSRNRYAEAKGTANVIINLKAQKIVNLSIFDNYYVSVQKELGEYYKDLAIYCEKESEYYPARVCRWAAEELKKTSSYGDKIVKRRAEQNQYIGDLYNECH